MKLLNCLILSLVLTFTPACSRYIVHPGSVNTFDSVTYDTLHDVKAVIDTGRDQIASGELSQSMKAPLNVLVDAYNLAYPAWNLWRDAVEKNKPAQTFLDDLNKNMAAVVKALNTFRTGKP